MLTIIEVKVKASPLVAKSVLDIEFWSQAYILDICIICISSDVASFLVAKLLYKSKCPSVCPYVNHV